MSNIILKGVGGFYTIKTPHGIVTAKPRGIFREQGIKPLAGDYVTLSEDTDGEAFSYVITDIAERKNELVRPRVANVDRLIIVTSVVEPNFSPLLLDRLAVSAGYKGIEVAVIITKSDIKPAEHIFELYKNSGYTLFLSGEHDEELIELTKNGLSVLCGNSGVGKSTVLNRVFNLERSTGDISKKLGRGRHTTREAELIILQSGGFVADTPGFSSLSLSQLCDIKKEELCYEYAEFSSHLGKCKFDDCSHLREVGCAVKNAVQSGEINEKRYESYVMLHEEL